MLQHVERLASFASVGGECVERAREMKDVQVVTNVGLLVKLARRSEGNECPPRTGCQGASKVRLRGARSANSGDVILPGVDTRFVALTASRRH